jgi:hypothetical protein
MDIISNAKYAELDAGHGGCVENPGQFFETADKFFN